MKKIATALFALTGTAAIAGGQAEPIMEMDPVIINEVAAASSSNAGLIIPLIILALLAAALSSSSST